MNILGVGTWEFVVIILIMLIVAGPKRMVHWMYILGRYMGKLRVMWSEMVGVVQQEFDQAGLDIKLPKEPPTRHSINKMAAETMKPFTAPLREAAAEVEAEAKAVQDTVRETNQLLKDDGQKPGPNQSSNAASDNGGPKPDFGAWSGTGKKES